jgi:lipopolysaccharide transport system ATP-binding protein
MKSEILPEQITDTSSQEEILISVENVSKKFCRSLKKAYLYGLKDIGAELLGTSRNSHQLRAHEFWALNNVNLQLKRGESLGLIGINGSGKTTLMRIIAGLLKPDIGKISVKGRIASLNVLGAGFNPVLSGRENVYINMSILGLSKKEIDLNFQNVLDFAEIWDAIDSPVRTYSSGMKARLGFACAVYTQPEILLIDEVLAVGDFSFRTKCYRKLSELRKSGVSFVLVSHSASSILSTCDSALYLAKGKMVMSGDAKTVVKKYEEDLSSNKVVQTSTSKGIVSFQERVEDVDRELQIKSISLRDKEGNILEHLRTGRPAYLYIECQAYKELKEVSANLIIRNLAEQETCYLFLESSKDIGFIQVEPGNFTVKLLMPYCGLLNGAYSIKLNLTHNGSYYTILDAVESFKFEVKGSEHISQCSYHQPRAWQFES